MVDRVYKSDLPLMKKALEGLKDKFSELDSPRTNWVGLRMDLLLKHIDSLESLLQSRQFSREFSHLRKGVALFHSDLVYLRTNVKALNELLHSEMMPKRGNRTRNRRPRVT